MITVIIPWDDTCESIPAQLEKQMLRYDKDVIAGYEEDVKALLHLQRRWYLDDKMYIRVNNKIHKDVMNHIKATNPL